MNRIRRRTLLQSSLALGSAIGAREVSAKGVGARRRPNVLWISADDLGCTLGCYGDERVHSPHIDAFAAESALFERAYCQIAVCSASRTSIMTGTRPETTGLFELEHDWRARLPNQKSIAAHFAERGYHTHSLGKIFDPRSGPGNAEGWVSQRNVWGIERADDALLQMDELADMPEDQPWFYAVGFKQPHCPWEPSEGSAKLYPKEKMRLRGSGRRFPNEYLEKCSGANQEFVDDAGAQEVLSRYMGEVSDFDREFGRIYDKAKALGFLENTIVICWSGDHGYQLSENDRWGKWTNYDASTRVPLLMKFPGMPQPGARVSGLVETVDMYATLCRLCDLPEPEQHEGLSFAPLFHEPKRDWKKAAFSVWEDQSRSIKTEKHNLIVHDRPAEGSKETESVELYDLTTDPLEARNLARTEPELVAQLIAQLEKGPSGALPAAVPEVPPVVLEDPEGEAGAPSPVAKLHSAGCASCAVGAPSPNLGPIGFSALSLLGVLFAMRRKGRESGG